LKCDPYGSPNALMWNCPKCGEQIEDQFDSCWKCAEVPAVTEQTESSRDRKPRLHIPFRKVLIIAVIVALICLGFLLPTWAHQSQAARTVNMLQPLIASDARFTRVRVWRSGDHVTVGGIVTSETDERALHNMVDVTNPLRPVVFTLEIVPELRGFR